MAPLRPCTNVNQPMNTLKVTLQSSISRMRLCFLVLRYGGVKSFISDGPIKLYSSWMMNLAHGKEILHFNWMFSEKFVLEDFTLLAQKKF